MQNEELSKVVEMMQKGDEDAFIEVYRRFHNSLYFLALKMTKNEADAQDAVQETFIQIRASIVTLQNKDVFILWMKRILMNKCKNIFRKNRDIYMDDESLNELHLCEERREFLPQDNSRFNSTGDVLLELLNHLPFLYRQPLKERYYEQKSMKEIAEDMGIPLGTVKSRLRGAKKLLRSEVKIYEEKYNTKVDFNSSVLGSTILFGGMYKMMMHVLPKHASLSNALIFSSVIKATVILSVAAFSATAAYSVYQNNFVSNNAAMNPPTSFDLTGSDQEVYFTLKEWAHCENDIKERSHEEFEKILPLFQQLEKSEGAFWKMLEEENWVQAFRKYQK